MIKRVYALLLFVTMINSGSAQQNTPLDSSLLSLHPKVVFSSNSNREFVFSDNRLNVPTSNFSQTSNSEHTVIYTVEVFEAAKSHYAVNVRWLSSQPIRKGDILLARLSMRTRYAKQESGESVTFFYVQSTQPPHDKSFITQLGTDAEWKTFDIPFVAKQDLPSGGASICLNFGSLPQKIELSDVQLLNFEQKVVIEKLPTTRFTYSGREEGADWRTKALKRIEEIRTAPLVVKVVDAYGNAIKNAKVEARLVTSDFIWGTAVDEALLGNDLPESNRYRTYLKELFNTAVIENGFKGPAWNEQRRPETMRAFNWLERNGFYQRGHNLVWPAWKFNSSKMKSMALQDTATFNHFIKEQFCEKMSAVKGRVIAWDVVNELMHEREFFSYLPQDVVVEWFKLAHQLDPDAQLYINEYGMLNSLESPRNIQAYLDTITSFRIKGAPIQGIGIQGHVGRQPRNPAQVISDLDILKEYGLPVQITEFDINSPDEELQADYTRDFLIACYSHPVVTGFTMWGFWEPKHWKSDAAMFRADWSAKPNAAVWREWVCGKWKTFIEETTNENGEICVLGHLGKYEVVIQKDNVVLKSFFHLTKDAEILTVKME